MSDRVHQKQPRGALDSQQQQQQQQSQKDPPEKKKDKEKAAAADSSSSLHIKRSSAPATSARKKGATSAAPVASQKKDENLTVDDSEKAKGASTSREKEKHVVADPGLKKALRWSGADETATRKGSPKKKDETAPKNATKPKGSSAKQEDSGMAAYDARSAYVSLMIQNNEQQKRTGDALMDGHPLLATTREPNKRRKLAPETTTAAAASAGENDSWSEDLHRTFVEAVYETGLKHASPSVIIENMTLLHKALTSERVKSHLQKYRNRKQKSQDEFLQEYDSWLQKALTMGAAGSGGAGMTGASSMTAPTAIVEMMGGQKILGGDVAAYLTYSIMSEDDARDKQAAGGHFSADSNNAQLAMSPDIIRSGSQEYAKHFTGARIPFPSLTEEERRSPLGVSISHVMGLFYSMTQYLMKERQEREQREAGSNLKTVSDSGSDQRPAAAGQQHQPLMYPAAAPRDRMEYATRAPGAYVETGTFMGTEQPLPVDYPMQQQQQPPQTGVAGIDYRQQQPRGMPQQDEDEEVPDSENRADV